MSDDFVVTWYREKETMLKKRIMARVLNYSWCIGHTRQMVSRIYGISFSRMLEKQQPRASFDCGARKRWDFDIAST